MQTVVVVSRQTYYDTINILFNREDSGTEQVQPIKANYLPYRKQKRAYQLAVQLVA